MIEEIEKTEPVADEAKAEKPKRKKTEPVKEKIPDKVRIRLPRPTKGEDDTKLVGVNGKVYRIKKGVEVEVPRCVAEVLANAERAADKAFEYSQSV